MASILVFAILKHFVPKKVNFPEGMGFFFCHICGKSRGERGGGYRFFEKMENPGRWGGGGVLSELPPVVGVWIFFGTTQYSKMTNCLLSFT